MDCKCTAHVSYHAEGNTMTVKLDKIDWCPLHGAAEEMRDALKANSMVMFGDGSHCWCDVPRFVSSMEHDSWCELARAAIQKAGQ